MNASLPLDAIFSVVNAAALWSWVALIVGPRRPWLLRALGSGVVLGLCGVYAVLIQVFFFGVEGGGFFSLPAVQRLFESPAVALAGWVHYLVFDLFVGLTIARQADALGITRWLQAPILVVTFMFGPIGWLSFALLRALRAAPAPDDKAFA